MGREGGRLVNATVNTAAEWGNKTRSGGRTGGKERTRNGIQAGDGGGGGGKEEEEAAAGKEAHKLLLPSPTDRPPRLSLLSPPLRFSLSVGNVE